MSVLEYLTEEGEQWFRDIRVTEEEVARINSLLAERESVGVEGVEGMNYNCGAVEIRAQYHTTRERLLCALITSASKLISDEAASILVATFNERQGELIEIFTSVGFNKACEWVENPNSGNDIIAYVLTLPPNLFKVPDEEEEEDDGGDWGHDVEEEDYDY